MAARAKKTNTSGLARPFAELGAEVVVPAGVEEAVLDAPVELDFEEPEVDVEELEDAEWLVVVLEPELVVELLVPVVVADTLEDEVGEGKAVAPTS